MRIAQYVFINVKIEKQKKNAILFCQNCLQSLHREEILMLQVYFMKFYCKKVS